MSVMSIRIDDRKRKILKAIASIEGRTITDLVSELLDEYVERRRSELAHSQDGELRAIMKISEASFAEWDNEEDAVYDRL
jgi:predicted transcriptional regulator